MTECEIIKVDSDAFNLTPKIINFQNGQLANTKKLKCASFTNAENNTTIAIATDRLTYVGEVHDEAFHTLLAIRNKNTNKVRLVPVNSVSMNVCMVQGNESLETTLNNSSIQVRDLYKQFGSKRDKRRTEQYERMKINISNVEDELKSTVANVSVNEDDLVTHTVDENVVDYRPKINRNATEVKDVYNLDQIIQKDELKSLKELATDVITKSVIPEQLSEFALDCINKLKQASVTDKKRYEIILYCDAILKFFKLSQGSLKAKVVKIAPYPNNIVSKIVNEYTVLGEHSRLRPRSMRDKGVCYVIVLALIAMDYKLDLEPLSKSINVAIKKLGEVSRVLGAQPLSSSCRTTVVLKLPLPPPVSSFRKRK